MDVAEGSSPAARRARQILAAHFAREPSAEERPRLRRDADARAQRVRAALRELGAAPGEASVRVVATRAGLPASTTYRLLRALGAPQRPRPPSLAPPAPEPPRAPVLVVGCGGAGLRALDRLHRLGATGARTLALDTDPAALDAAEADAHLLAPKGARDATPALERLVAGASLVFVVAGLGAGTGTCAAPVVADVARRAGATVVGVASLPFGVERARLAKAEAGLASLQQAAHTTLVLEHDRLLRFVPNLPLDQAFRVMDTLVAEALKGILDTLGGRALLPLDRAATRALLASGGPAALLYGEARASDAPAAAREAFAHAFADVDAQASRGAIVQLAGGAGLSLADAQAVAEAVAARIAPGAEVVCGARVAPELGPRLRLSVLLVGAPLKARTP
ncbi:MAG TPA: helix-turn-helix domain-containing protein [Candidatus Thermoplasmatota archaeon]|nr:helix-turn-helix domain-containing protein [Candidatus Thermoplasmatota archaeon]